MVHHATSLHLAEAETETQDVGRAGPGQGWPGSAHTTAGCQIAPPLRVLWGRMLAAGPAWCSCCTSCRGCVCRYGRADGSGTCKRHLRCEVNRPQVLAQRAWAWAHQQQATACPVTLTACTAGAGCDITCGGGMSGWLGSCSYPSLSCALRSQLSQEESQDYRCRACPSGWRCNPHRSSCEAWAVVSEKSNLIFSVKHQRYPPVERVHGACTRVVRGEALIRSCTAHKWITWESVSRACRPSTPLASCDIVMM